MKHIALADLYDLVPAAEEHDIVEEVTVAGWDTFTRAEWTALAELLDLDVEPEPDPSPDPRVAWLTDQLGATVISQYERLD